MLKRVQSDFLFAQPSFASGAASSIDLWAVWTDYNTSSTVEEADADAIAADWCVVGQDIFNAMQLISSEK